MEQVLELGRGYSLRRLSCRVKVTEDSDGVKGEWVVMRTSFSSKDWKAMLVFQMLGGLTMWIPRRQAQRGLRNPRLAHVTMHCIDVMQLASLTPPLSSCLTLDGCMVLLLDREGLGP